MAQLLARQTLSVPATGASRCFPDSGGSSGSSLKISLEVVRRARAVEADDAPHGKFIAGYPLFCPPPAPTVLVAVPVISTVTTSPQVCACRPRSSPSFPLLYAHSCFFAAVSPVSSPAGSFAPPVWCTLFCPRRSISGAGFFQFAAFGEVHNHSGRCRWHWNHVEQPGFTAGVVVPASSSGVGGASLPPKRVFPSRYSVRLFGALISVRAGARGRTSARSLPVHSHSRSERRSRASRDGRAISASEWGVEIVDPELRLGVLSEARSPRPGSRCLRSLAAVKSACADGAAAASTAKC